MAAREGDKLEQSWTFGLLIVMLPLNFAIVEIFPSLCYLSPQFYDSGYFTEITGLFPGSGSCSVSIMREREGRPITRSPQVSLYEEGYITLDTARTQARQVAFLAEVGLALPALNIFMERWEEAVVRPTSRAEQDRLARRINIFCEENYCGKREDWSVALHRQT